MSNSMGLSDLASSLRTYGNYGNHFTSCGTESNSSSNRLYFNLHQPHITLMQVLWHSLYGQLLHFFTTNTVSCKLRSHHQSLQDSSILNPAPQTINFHHSANYITECVQTCWLYQGYTNPGCQVARATKFCMVIPNVCGSSVWHLRGHVVAQLVEALRYKPERRRFDSWWCHWNFSST